MQPTHIIVLFVIACGVACAATQEPAPKPTPHADTVQRLVGTWVGKGDTPLGQIPIALAFAREGTDVHAKLGGGEMYLDFRFHAKDGKWLLTEEGKFPGLGVQRHTLVPTGDCACWIAGDILDVRIELREPNLVFTTKLRGEPHATFTLTRAETKVSSRP